MSKVSKELVLAAGIIPKLKLGIKGEKGVISTGPHRVKLLADKVVPGKDYKTGKEIEYVRYLFEENGEKKTYETKKLNDKGDLSYFVQHLAEIEEGSEVILEMQKRGIKNFISVTPLMNKTEIEVEDEDEEEVDAHEANKGYKYPDYEGKPDFEPKE
jgi:hypothetical protein